MQNNPMKSKISRLRSGVGRCLWWLVRLCKDWPWQYGVCTAVSTKRARRHRLTGEVQFVLWEKGYQVGDYTYADDYWTSYDKSWWGHFLPNTEGRHGRSGPLSDATG